MAHATVTPSMCRPGLRFLVSFEDDPGWHHERLLEHRVEVIGEGSEATDVRMIVLTLDADEYVESLSDYSSCRVLSGSKRYPADVGDVVSFGVVLSLAQIRRQVESGRVEADRANPEEGRAPLKELVFLD